MNHLDEPLHFQFRDRVFRVFRATAIDPKHGNPTAHWLAKIGSIFQYAIRIALVPGGSSSAHPSNGYHSAELYNRIPPMAVARQPTYEGELWNIVDNRGLVYKTFSVTEGNQREDVLATDHGTLQRERDLQGLPRHTVPPAESSSVNKQ